MSAVVIHVPIAVVVAERLDHISIILNTAGSAEYAAHTVLFAFGSDHGRFVAERMGVL